MNDPNYDLSAGLDGLNPVFERLAMRAGWNKKEPSLWKEPRVSYRPMHWRWDDARRGLRAAAPLISTELAERRNLFLVNPIEANHYDTLRTLVSAYQMIRPGERARSHRHSPNALRLVLEAADDVYTVVDGERLDMKPRDVVLTPGGMWHGHANDGGMDAFWIDFLDVPLVHLLEPMFMEHWPAGFQEPECANQSAHLCFAWTTLEPQLLAQLEQPDCSVARVRLDARSLPTMELAMTMLRAGAAGPKRRSTENQIVAVVEGSGTTSVGGEVFHWSQGDVMALPGWLAVQHAAAAGGRATLFSVSDALMQQKLGFLRVEELNAEGGARG